MIEKIQEAFSDILQDITWMNAETRITAKEKVYILTSRFPEKHAVF